jgi:prophage antirepressor-like protein
MKNDLKIFEHPEFGQVRVHLDEQGNPWWVAADVCRVLEIQNPSDAISSLKDDEKMTIANPDGHSGQRGGAQFFNIINEPGYYRFIFKSRVPKAEKFQHWTFHEMLPSIRKFGAYLTPDKIEEVLLNPDTIIKLATELKAERDRVAALELEKAANASKVHFAEAILPRENDIQVGELAAIILADGTETGRNRLFKYFRENGWLIKQDHFRFNMPSQKGVSSGFFRFAEAYKMNGDSHVYDVYGRPIIEKFPVVTPAGQEHFIRLFKEKGEEEINSTKYRKDYRLFQ